MSDWRDFGAPPKRGLYVGVRYRRCTLGGSTSTRVATIFVGGRKKQPSEADLQLHLGGRRLFQPQLLVVWHPALLRFRQQGYYVQPSQYGDPEGIFLNCFANLDQAVAHGRALLREALAATKALQGLGVW